MLYTRMVYWCALFRFLAHPKEVFGDRPNSGRACKDNREEFGFALVGHDFKSVHAGNFARCFFACSLEERCQSVTFLWNLKECQMKKETKKSRPEDFVENPAATYMENNVRGLSIQLSFFRQRTRLDGSLFPDSLSSPNDKGGRGMRPWERGWLDAGWTSNQMIYQRLVSPN